jgi:N-formylglutamate deformylase
MTSKNLHDSYRYVPPSSSKARAVLISVPHCGTMFPEDLKSFFKAKFVSSPEDTDWFVDELYDFAPKMGIGLIAANYSRYVIDLNRDPANSSLYSDGRSETELIPSKSFAGELLSENVHRLSSAETTERLDRYYWPYHHKIAALLKDLQNDHKHVLFFDAHSIKRFVPTIRKHPFPDMILGNQDNKTCDGKIIAAAKAVLSKEGGFNVSCNEPFKGGYLTRSIGNPQKGIHALQLEMPQDNYMNEVTVEIVKSKFQNIQRHLARMLAELAHITEQL